MARARSAVLSAEGDMEFCALNPFSRAFAQQIAASHPEWLPLAHPDATPGVSPGSLFIEVPSTRGDTPLTISTDNDEITISFGGFHTHRAADDDESRFDEVLGFIEDVLHEWIVVVSAFEGERWVGSCCCKAHEAEERFEAYLTAGGRRTVRIQSWRGTFDRVQTL